MRCLISQVLFILRSSALAERRGIFAIIYLSCQALPRFREALLFYTRTSDIAAEGIVSFHPKPIRFRFVTVTLKSGHFLIRIRQLSLVQSPAVTRRKNESPSPASCCLDFPTPTVWQGSTARAPQAILYQHQANYPNFANGSQPSQSYDRCKFTLLFL